MLSTFFYWSLVVLIVQLVHSLLSLVNCFVHDIHLCIIHTRGYYVTLWWVTKHRDELYVFLRHIRGYMLYHRVWTKTKEKWTRKPILDYKSSSKNTEKKRLDKITSSRSSGSWTTLDLNRPNYLPKKTVPICWGKQFKYKKERNSEKEKNTELQLKQAQSKLSLSEELHQKIQDLEEKLHVLKKEHQEFQKNYKQLKITSKQAFKNFEFEAENNEEEQINLKENWN